MMSAVALSKVLAFEVLEADLFERCVRMSGCGGEEAGQSKGLKHRCIALFR